MAADSKNLIFRFNNISQQPAIRQLGLLLGLATSIAMGVGLVQWAVEPNFSTLYGDLSPAAAAEIVRSLEASGTRYKVNLRSGLISVPADQIHEVRLNLAGEGLPKGDGSGFEMLYKEQEVGVSSFMEKARFDRALEQELSSSIASMDSVRSARVHLALPKQSAFVRKRNKPAASVLVSLYAGRELTERQLAGVVHMIAFSVPGLEAEQVSVVDNRGKLLTSRERNDGFTYTKDQFRFARQLEQSYVDRITNILTPILGFGAVRAEVTAEVDFMYVERTSESYSPDRKIRNEQLVEEITNGGLSGGVASGIPGTLSNQPPPESTIANSTTSNSTTADGTTVPVEASLPSRSNKREVRNYELDKTISHIREAPGVLKKLSVAVVVDYQSNTDDEGVDSREPMSEEKLAEVEALIKEAVGFDETRGDRMNLVNASFVKASELEALPEPSLMEQEWVWRAAKLAVAGVAIFLVIFAVLKPIMKISSVIPPVQRLAVSSEQQPGLAISGATHSPDGLVLGEDQVTLGGPNIQGLAANKPAYDQQLNMARSMVEGEPERAAHVVRNWVAADG